MGGFRERHKLALQGLAFAVIMLTPVGLYRAAKSGSELLIFLLLGLMGGGMALAAWAS